MDLPLVATASGVLSTALSAMKYVREVSDSTDDLELKSRINDLYTALLDVRAKVLELDEENCRLKTELARKDDIEGPVEPFGYFFTKQKPKNPLCPKCLQSEPSKVVFLGSLRKHKGGQLRKCPVCTYGNYEEPPTTGPAIAVGPSLSSVTRSYWS
jgi:hypothetical protein